MATVLNFDRSPVSPPAATAPVRWLTAQEIADLALPGLPRAKRKVNKRARMEGWAFRIDAQGQPLARARSGRGGGLEYHPDVLPPSARAALVKRDEGELPASLPSLERQMSTSPSEVSSLECQMNTSPREVSIWHWFDHQKDSVKAEAKRRLAALDAIARYEAAGMTRSAALAVVSGEIGKSQATLWAWLDLVKGAPATDYLPHLAPRRQGGGREAEVDAELWQFLISDYLRPERPTWQSCWWRAKRLAEASGLALPCARTLERKFAREIDERLVLARRHGADALRNSVPAQRRSVAELHALELLNIDGHKWDVFVEWPDGRVARPIMVALQDVYSRKVLGWRVGDTESFLLTRLAFADTVRQFGIPRGMFLDNGRAFAAKGFTGGTANRYRFKVREEEPLGVLTALGVEVHWTRPYRGQSKPIERAFRDMCDHIAKDPRLAGAWTGNRPDNKPENYGGKAIPLADFCAIVAEGIAAHNARPGRRTETGQGRHSFDDVFNLSYMKAAIGKATPEQVRIALLAADQVKADRKDGSIMLMGNRYFAAELMAVAGERVTVRFDPDDLHSEVHVYDKEGRFIATAPVWSATGFQDAQAAKDRARMEADLRKASKRQAELHGLISAADLAARMPAAPPASDVPEPQVIRPVRVRSSAALAALSTPAERAARDAAAAHREDVADRLAKARLRLVEND